MNKGIRDGVAVGDILDDYMDERLWGSFAQFQVTKVRSHDCEAEILRNTGAPQVEDLALIVAHTVAKRRRK